MQTPVTETPPRYTVHCCARGSLLKARATALKPIDRDRKAVKTAVFKLRRALKAWFKTQRLRLAEVLATETGKVAKTKEDEIADAVKRIIDDLNFEGYEAFADIAASEFEKLMRDSVEQAAKQLVSSVATGINDGSLSVDALKQANEQAIAWAKDRAAEMVGKKWIDGELVDNPNAEYAITDGTRDMLQRFVTDALESGDSNEDLADGIKAVYAFSDDRAEMIARTETARADVEGALETYRATGLVEQKEWLAAPDCCDECQAMDGDVVPLDGLFGSDGGVAGPPLHPNCRCDVLPVITNDTTENDE